MWKTFCALQIFNKPYILKQHPPVRNFNVATEILSWLHLFLDHFHQFLISLFHYNEKNYIISDLLWSLFIDDLRSTADCHILIYLFFIFLFLKKISSHWDSNRPNLGWWWIPKCIPKITFLGYWWVGDFLSALTDFTPCL